MAYSLILGSHRPNLHVIYLETDKVGLTKKNGQES